MKIEILSDLTQLVNAQSGTRFIINNKVSTFSMPPLQTELIDGLKVCDIAEGVTLIFNGGEIAGPYWLKGNNTAIEAPICKIFGEDLGVLGTWLMDRAYPQWFDEDAGKQRYFDNVSSADYNNFLNSLKDCAPAINKAMSMKKVGEVFLPQGNYYVNETLIMPSGIQLVGEGEAVISKLVNGVYQKSAYISTRIIPYIPSSGETNEENPVMEINIYQDSWKANHPLPSKVSNIIFDNCLLDPIPSNNNDNYHKTKFSNLHKISNKGCCYVAGACTFENVAFKEFRRAIKWTENEYSDRKVVSGCFFGNGFTDNDKNNYPQAFAKDAYVVDFKGLGDALTMNNCQFGENLFTEGVSCFALRLEGCHGASIRDNIINTDVYIESCLAVVFEANHLENGAQLRIIGSKLTVSNNWFEKGYRPSVCIAVPYRKDPSNDEFVNYNATFSMVEFISNSFIFFNVNKKRPNNSSIPCEYDILIKKPKVEGPLPIKLHIVNSYRITLLHDNCNQPSGIWLCKEDKPGDENYLIPIKEFNDYSYFLSRESTLLTDGKIVTYENADEMPLVTAVCSTTDQIPYVQEDNEIDGAKKHYSFSIKVFLDKERKIVSPEASQIVEPNNYSPYSVVIDTPDNKSAIGMLITMRWKTYQTDCLIRLIRSTVTETGTPIISTTYDEVEIPVCGSVFLYDNGTSVNGFKWITKNISKDPNKFNSCFESVEYRGKNVICTAPFFPTEIFGKWQRGDIIKVLPKDNNTTVQCVQYMYDGNKWLLVN